MAYAEEKCKKQISATLSMTPHSYNTMHLNIHYTLHSKE
jgi:hypothetical protein